MEEENIISKSIIAGMCISTSCILYSNIENKIIGSLLFSFGLLVIMQYNLYLYTGRIYKVKFNIRDVKKIMIVLFCNFVGCNFMVFIFQMCGFSNNIEIISNIKYDIPLIQMFFRSIPCGALMCFATLNKNNKITTILCVATFIICGFEHSIADMFYLVWSENRYILDYFIRILIVVLGNAIGSITVYKMIGGESK